MALPDFMWLWRAAAWSMGGAMVAYVILAGSGFFIFRWIRQPANLPEEQRRGAIATLAMVHMGFGVVMVLLILFLLAIGVVGTLGHFGSLGHSVHLPIGILTVQLTLVSAWSAMQILQGKSWARRVHLISNGGIAIALLLALISGWSVVKKYLP
ncbi:MAG: DUF4079 domain-containing protein [Cyanobacteria bacterium P01_C01_bin.89]